MQPWQQATLTQPLHCDLRPGIPLDSATAKNYDNYTHMNNKNNHTLKNTNREPIRNRCTHKVPFIAACSHFTRNNTRFRSPAPSPTEVPCNSHAAITVRFAQSRGKFACINAHGTTACQQSRSHYTAICSQRCDKRMQRRTHEQALVAELIRQSKREPNRARNDRSRNRCIHKVPLIAACSHFRRTTQGIMLWFPPQPMSHVTFMPPLRCVLLQHVVTSFNHHPLRHHPFVITLRHHPSSSLPSVTTSSSPSVITSPATTPFVTTFRPHFPQLPSFLTIFVITLRHHCPPLSPFVITHHFLHSLPCVIYIIYCYLL